MKKNYYVQYTENGSPHMYVATSKKEVDSFLNKFVKKYKSLDDGGSWVSHVFHGQEIVVKGVYRWYTKKGEF